MKTLRLSLAAGSVLFSFFCPAYAQDSSTSEAVRQAHDQLQAWLGSGSRAEGWGRYLMSDELKEQMALGPKGDKRVVKQILAKYSSDIPGLDLPRFVAVREALQTWLDELKVPTVEELPKAAKEAKEDFVPVTEQALSSSREQVRGALDALEKFLGGDSYGAAWRELLHVDELRAHLDGDKRASEDEKVLEDVLRRFSNEYRGLEMDQFTSVRDALTAYLRNWRLARDPSPEKSYHEQLEVLAASLSAYRKSNQAADLRKMASALDWLEDRGLAEHVTKVTRAHYWKPNLFIEIGDDVVAYGFYENFNDTDPISDSREGTRVTGSSQTVGQTSARLVPNDYMAVIHNEFQGVTYARTTAYASQATVFSRGETHIRAIKQVVLGRRGFRDYPTTAAAITESETTGINSAYASQARQRVEQGRPANNARASREAEARIKQRMDERTSKQLEEANDDYYRTYVKPLADRLAFPNLVRFRSTKDALLVSSIQAKNALLSALSDPPAEPEGKATTVRVHESWVNNTCLAMYGDRTIGEKEFRDELTTFVGGSSQRFQRKSTNPPWTVTFTSQAPVTMSFDRDTVLIVLRGISFRSGNAPPRNIPMNIVGNYRIAARTGKPKLVRQGDLQVLPPKLVTQLDKDGDGWINPDEERGIQPGSLSAQQASLRGELQETFSELLEEELEPEPRKLTGRWQSLGQLKPDYLAVEQGWLTLGYQIDRPQAKDTAKK